MEDVYRENSAAKAGSGVPWVALQLSAAHPGPTGQEAMSCSPCQTDINKDKGRRKSMFRRMHTLGAAGVFAVVGSLATMGTAGAQQIPPPLPPIPCITATVGPPSDCSPLLGLLPISSIVSDLVLFSGQATITGDSDGAPAPGENPNVDLVGGSGTFSFTTNVLPGFALCYSDFIDGDAQLQLGLSVGGIPVNPPGPCSISAAGTFTNLVCGTGQAAGASVVVGPDGTSTNRPFLISFYGTIGIVTGDITSDVNEPLYGVVQLGPPLNGALPDVGDMDCTPGFTATGAVAAFEVPGS